MTPEEFIAAFGGSITVCFNWNRFLAERWPVSLHTLSDRQDLEHCFIPWYLDSSGRPIQDATPDDAPLQVCTIPSALATIPEGHRCRIEECTRWFRAETTPLVFRIPTYTLPGGRFQVLDGNHRLSALTLMGRPFTVALCSVDGPIDGDCSRDLRYWAVHGQA